MMSYIGYIFLSLIEEIFRAFYYDNELIKDAPLIRWGTKDTETGYRTDVDYI